MQGTPGAPTAQVKPQTSTGKQPAKAVVRKWLGGLIKITGVVALLVFATFLIMRVADSGEPRPFRTAWSGNGQPPSCDPNPGDSNRDRVELAIRDLCSNQIWERRSAYDLLFAEFTDQGLQFPEGLDGIGEAHRQIDHILDGLNRIESGSTNGISLIVFVHGWRHNASYDDSNVQDFRKLLEAAAHAERETGYRVVGIYVGWRGQSSQIPGLEYLTFWGRKEAAARVAQGSTRELFNRLRNFRCARNRPSNPETRSSRGFDDCSWTPTSDRPRARVNTVLAGHSFGAWILYNSLAGALLETVAHHHDADQHGPANLRYADLVVLLNPAFEASRFTPLHRISSRPTARESYQTPMLVSVTSENDKATHWLFPLGRYVNSLLERTVGDEERRTFFSTPGHTPGYITHSLKFIGHEAGTCAGWQDLTRFFEAVGSRPDDLQARDAMNAAAEANLQSEVAHSRQFVRNYATTGNRGVRKFCSGLELEAHRPSPESQVVHNTIVWNVQARSNVMAEHNDHSNPHLLDFIRELYLEVSRIPPTCRTSRRTGQDQADDPACR